jgi:hypothetical protein
MGCAKYFSRVHFGGMHQCPATTVGLASICSQKQRMTWHEKSARWTRMTRFALNASKELYALTQLGKSIQAKRNKLICDKMDALAREVGALKPRDARRADIVNEIIRLSHLIVK